MLVVHDQHQRMMKAVADGNAEAFIDESHKHHEHAIAALAETFETAAMEPDQKSA